jgi:hypothetical protein
MRLSKANLSNLNNMSEIWIIMQSWTYKTLIIRNVCDIIVELLGYKALYFKKLRKVFYLLKSNILFLHCLFIKNVIFCDSTKRV